MTDSGREPSKRRAYFMFSSSVSHRELWQDKWQTAAGLQLLREAVERCCGRNWLDAAERGWPTWFPGAWGTGNVLMRMRSLTAADNPGWCLMIPSTGWRCVTSPVTSGSRSTTLRAAACMTYSSVSDTPAKTSHRQQHEVNNPKLCQCMMSCKICNTLERLLGLVSALLARHLAVNPGCRQLQWFGSIHSSL
jgi:hypothetical protein